VDTTTLHQIVKTASVPRLQYLRFTTKLNDVLHDILKHGFGEAVIRISIQKENKRTIVIESGKSYQYTVNLSEMQK